MADKLANADIEDVLSSIRRLVSDESEGHGPVPDDGDPANSFLLTPALRVLPAEDASGALGDRAAELEDAVAGDPDFEPDGGEPGTVLDYPPSLVRAAGDEGAPAAPRRRLTLGLSDAEPEDAQPEDAEGPLDLSANLRLVPPAEAPAEVAEDELDEILLDEEGLRDMVVQIVREELQGSLGEQITSNIRKLIRREIHDYFDVRDSE